MQSSYDSQNSMTEDISNDYSDSTSYINISSLQKPVFLKNILTESKVMNIGITMASILRSHDLSFFFNSVQNTDFKILSDRILIYGEDKDKIEECQKLIEKQIIENIRKEEFKVNEQRDIYILKETPSIIQYLDEKKCKLINSELNVVISSFERTEEELKAIKQKLVNHSIWVIQWRNPKHSNTIYVHISDYLKQVLETKAAFFKERGIKVQMNIRNSHILVDGLNSFKKMEVKNMIANIINSTLVIEIKTDSSDKFKKTESYLKKIQHPLIFRRTLENTYILVSKDNILKQLFTKQKFTSFLNINKQNKVGFFLIETNKTGDKITALKNFVANNQFYLQNRNAFHYVFQSMNIEKQGFNKYLQFISKMLDFLIGMANKNKLDITLKPPQKKNTQVIDSNTFVITGIPFTNTSELTSKFGCDIKMNTLYLNSEYLKRYERMEGKQMTNKLFNIVDWCEPEETKICEIVRQKMEGKYYYGKVKRSENQVMYLPEYIVDVL